MTAELLHDPETEGPPRTPVDGVNVLGSLSPSRASDFMSCPLLYRFRVIDQIPEAPDPYAARGTLVHAVLERLFDLPAGRRTLEEAAALLRPQWDELVAAEPQIAELFPDPEQLTGWLDECRSLLETYFSLEDPRCLEPAERELYVEHVLDSKLLVRGYVDRLDVNGEGLIRVVDYKTGQSPSEFFEAKALFQMKFYALTLWRSRGRIPKLLQLVYLGNGEILRYEPDEADLLATERKVNALWLAIARATETGDWRPRKSALCDWCDHKSRCPEWGGTLPPLPTPEEIAARAARDKPSAGRRADPSGASPAPGGNPPAGGSVSGGGSESPGGSASSSGSASPGGAPPLGGWALPGESSPGGTPAPGGTPSPGGTSPAGGVPAVGAPDLG